jgi:capsular polysaccharide biosynthesis protein/Mrp family chromosome partitioning ATPase
MNPNQRPDSFEGADYFGGLRRHWLLVVVLACVGLVGAFGYATVAPKSYAATAAVNVNPIAGQPGSTVANGRTGPNQVNLDTEAQIVVSTTVATIAGHILHSTLTPYALAKQITVTVPPNSSVLDITCTTSTATGAAACANAFAKAYLQNRTATAVSNVNSELRKLQAKIGALQHSISVLGAKAHSSPKNSTARNATLSARAADVSLLHQLNAQLGPLNGQLVQSNGGAIISPASPPGKPASPKKLLVLPSGLVAGLLIGLAAAVLVDRRDKSIHGARDVERYLDVPVLLNLPPGTFGRDVSVASPRSRTGQAFTELGHAVSAALGEGNHILLVAGTSRGSDRIVGRSVIAANLAATLARTHSEAVLVCADMNNTVAPALLGVGDGDGLAELFTGTATVRDVARAPAAIPGLWVIGPGSDPSLALYHLRHDTARALTSQLRADARFVIIEAQATDDGADSLVLGEFADAAVVTVEISRTDRTVAADCVRRLRQLRAPVLGAVSLPALGGRVGIRPPSQRQPRLSPTFDEPVHDRAVEGQVPREPAGMPMAGGVPDRRERSRNGRGERVDRVRGG